MLQVFFSLKLVGSQKLAYYSIQNAGRLSDTNVKIPVHERVFSTEVRHKLAKCCCMH